ncbi:15702_t:CDS:1, partial [Acaulospora morrowiae]
EILHPYDRRYNHPQPLFQYSSHLKIFPFADIAKIIVEGWKRRNKSVNLFKKIRIERLEKIMTAIFYLVMRTSCLREIEIFDYYGRNGEQFIYNISKVISFSSYQYRFSQLRNLTIHIKKSSYLKESLRNLSKLCINLQRLEYRVKQDLDSETVDALADIITAQSNLKNFLIETHIKNYQRRFISHLDFQKESLTSLSLHFIDFSVISLNSIAKYTKLESMEIYSCYGATKGNCEMFMQSSIKLKSLTIDTYQFVNDTLLATFIEKAGKNLLNLHTDRVSEKLMTPLSRFCPNISKFSLLDMWQDCSIFMDYLKGSNISQLIIKSHCRSDELLIALGKHVPSSLEKLYLHCHFRPECLGKFLLDYSKSSLNTLETLYIKYIDGHSLDYLKVIEHYAQYNALKTVVIETTVDMYEASGLIQKIKNKGINILF